MVAILEWEQHCPKADEVLENLAIAYKGQVEKDVVQNVWPGVKEDEPDQPTRVLSWRRGGTKYSISMILEPSLHIWATAWRDNEAALSHPSLKPAERILPVPTDQGVFKTTIDELLKEIKPRVRLLNLRGISQDIIVSPLSPRPLGF